eukprot:7450594-Lingulodinium_polyedra.AAC.1
MFAPYRTRSGSVSSFPPRSASLGAFSAGISNFGRVAVGLAVGRSRVRAPAQGVPRGRSASPDGSTV